MEIQKVQVDLQSEIAKFLPADYSDAYECCVDVGLEVPAEDLLVAIWTDFPGWVIFLLKLRNLLVKPLGLKGAEDFGRGFFEKCIRHGECGEMVSVPAKSCDEAVLRVIDKHLTFHMSIQIKRGMAKSLVLVNTLVNFNNSLGRFYFFWIKPFHALVVKSMIRHRVASLKKLK